MFKRNIKKRLLLLVSLILVGGFLTTSLVSYFIALSSLRDQITTSALPLTSDNVYSEIQRDLIKLIYISSMMAHDTFLRDWVIAGEQNEEEMTKYLKEIMVKYDTFTSFFVSEKTRIYYHAEGILKKVHPEEERDIWYFRVREMGADYEINVDPDMANRDALTVFINHRVHDYKGNYLGAIGVGLTIHAVLRLIENYHEKYNSHIYFVDPKGTVVLRSNASTEDADTLYDMEGISAIADEVLAGETQVHQYVQKGQLVHLNARFVPELNWHLLVEQMEGEAVGGIYDTLILNLILCTLITGVVIALTTLTINAFQRVNQRQQDEIVQQHQVLFEQHAKLEVALAQVKTLSGLLPICASCKKIRDDGGTGSKLNRISGSIPMRNSHTVFARIVCGCCIRITWIKRAIRIRREERGKGEAVSGKR